VDEATLRGVVTDQVVSGDAEVCSCELVGLVGGLKLALFGAKGELWWTMRTFGLVQLNFEAKYQGFFVASATCFLAPLFGRSDTRI